MWNNHLPISPVFDDLSFRVESSESSGNEESVFSRKLFILWDSILLGRAHYIDLIFVYYCQKFREAEHRYCHSSDKSEKHAHIAIMMNRRTIKFHHESLPKLIDWSHSVNYSTFFWTKLLLFLDKYVGFLFWHFNID